LDCKLWINKKVIIKEKMYRLDIWVEKKVIVDVKSVEAIPAVYKKQVLTYPPAGGQEVS
jgi:GxxExxY protein